MLTRIELRRERTREEKQEESWLIIQGQQWKVKNLHLLSEEPDDHIPVKINSVVTKPKILNNK